MKKKDILRVKLIELLEKSEYTSYVYSYPHKMSYRPLSPKISLKDLWKDEKKDALFLYVHIPFCEMRCGFCNLFTTAKPKDNIRLPYPEMLELHAQKNAEALGEDRVFSRVAIGGGTPTQLDMGALVRVLDTIEITMGADLKSIPSVCEMSPETVTSEKLKLLRARGIDRASIGIQSFIESETKALRRPQKLKIARKSLDLIRTTGFETLNIDLIYGTKNQTKESFLFSLRETLKYSPEEIYLYPLYVRPLTGLGNSKAPVHTDQRMLLYICGRDFLLEAGYEQISMRMFRKPVSGNGIAPPIYKCQEDGMVGIGVGARSYTKRVHYCTEYAVGRSSVLNILEDYIARDDASFSYADFGIELNIEEQMRRYFMLSLLSYEGFSNDNFMMRFPGILFPFMDEVELLKELNFLVEEKNRIMLTPHGISLSDVIGPWLFSSDVKKRVKEYELT